MFADMWDLFAWDWFWEDTEEVKQKRKKLREAKEKALEKWKQKERQKQTALSPLDSSLSLLQVPKEEEFRKALEKYEREHPEEEVRGIAIDRDNLMYRALQIHRRIQEKKKEK